MHVFYTCLFFKFIIIPFCCCCYFLYFKQVYVVSNVIWANPCSRCSVLLPYVCNNISHPHEMEEILTKNIFSDQGQRMHACRIHVSLCCLIQLNQISGPLNNLVVCGKTAWCCWVQSRHVVEVFHTNSSNSRQYHSAKICPYLWLNIIFFIYLLLLCLKINEIGWMANLIFKNKSNDASAYRRYNNRM